MTAHACNNPLTCPACVRRFWKWAESHTRGRAPRGEGGKPAPIDPDTTPSFYLAAAKFMDVDARSRR